MISNEIQDMLDGSLNDEQMSEMLHRLSVSPEKRAMFSQHMALRGTFERDRSASALKSDEDAAVLGAILGAGTGAAVTGSASGWVAGWFAKTAAMVGATVVGFIIGTSVTNSVFDGATQQPRQALGTVEQNAMDAASGQNAIAAVSGGTVEKQMPPAVAAQPVASGQPQVIYRDRIVYRSVPAQDIAGTALSTHATVQQPVQQDEASRTNGNDATTNTLSANNINASTPRQSVAVANHVVANNAVNSAEATTTTPEILAINPDVHKDNTIRQDKANEASLKNTESIVAATDYSKVEPNDMLSAPEELRERSPNAQNPAAEISLMDAFMKDGFEVGYNERIGRVSPVPKGVEEVDPEFSSRSIDLVYRIADGQFGIGGRLLYGTLAKVSLESETWYELGIVDVIFTPQLKAEKQFGLEMFANYRVPITDRFALGMEGSFGGASTYLKAGGEFSAMFLITDYLGAHAGIGASNYWYNLNDQRDKAFNGLANTGITSEANDNYQGSMIEGRYGLFFRF